MSGEGLELSRAIAAFVDEHKDDLGIYIVDSHLKDFAAWAAQRGLGALGALICRAMNPANKTAKASVDRFATWLFRILNEKPAGLLAISNLAGALAGELDTGKGFTPESFIDTDSAYWHRVFKLLQSSCPPPTLAQRLGIKPDLLRQFVHEGIFPTRMKKETADKAQRLFAVVLAKRYGITGAEIDASLAENFRG